MTWEDDYQRDFATQKSSGPIVFTEDQRKKNMLLKEKVKDVLPLDDALKTSDCDLLYRFLIGRHWDVKSAEQMVRQYIRLRKEHKLNNIMAETPPADVKAVISVIHGVDKDGLPIIWMAPDPAKLLPVLKSRPREELLRAQMYVMEEARFVSRARGVDRCTYVIDMGKITISSINTQTLGFLRELIKILQEYYPEIMRRLLIFNTGWAITGAWKVLKPFVDARVQDKIRFANGPPSVKSLAEFMAADHVRPEYGGLGEGSVLDEPLRVEVARLRALTATPPPAAIAAPPTPPPPAAGDVAKSGGIPQPQSPSQSPRRGAHSGALTSEAARPQAPHTQKRESPRTTEVCDDALPESGGHTPTQLFQLYDSFASDNTAEDPSLHPVPAARQSSTNAAGAPAELYNTDSKAEDTTGDFQSFHSALSGEDDGNDGSGAEEKGTVLIGNRNVLSQLSDFFAVDDGYLEEPGIPVAAAAAAAAREDAESVDSAIMDGLEGSEEAVTWLPTRDAATTPNADVRPLEKGGGDGVVHADPQTGLPAMRDDAVAAMQPVELPATNPLSSPAARVRNVELSLTESADGAVIGFYGRERIGEFRGSTIYGNAVGLSRAPNLTPQQQRGGGNGTCAPGGHNDEDMSEAAAVLRTSFSPVTRHASPPSSGKREGAAGDDSCDNSDEAHCYIVGELLRESGHPIHNYVIVCDAKRKARFIVRKSWLRSRVSVYLVVGDATVTTDGQVRHRIAGQKVRMGSAVASSSTASPTRRDPSAWVLYGEDITRRKRGLASTIWPFGRGPTNGNREKAEAAANAGTENALLAEFGGQMVKFYGLLAHSHPVDLFTLTMAITQLWRDGETTATGAGLAHGRTGRKASTSGDGEGSDGEDDGGMIGGEVTVSGRRPLGRTGHHVGSNNSGLAAVGELLREVGNKISKTIDSKIPSTNKQP